MVIVVSVVLILLCKQTDIQTDADERFTPATIVGVSNSNRQCWLIIKANQPWTVNE